jgi:hypothetical protein
MTANQNTPGGGGKFAGTLKIQGDVVRKTEDIIKFQIRGILKSRKFLCFGFDNPYLLIERGKIDKPGDYMRIFKTDFKYEDANPWWDTYSMSMTDFCNNNKHLPLRLTVKSHSNHGEHPIYGSVETTTREIEMA